MKGIFFEDTSDLKLILRKYEVRKLKDKSLECRLYDSCMRPTSIKATLELSGIYSGVYLSSHYEHSNRKYEVNINMQGYEKLQKTDALKSNGNLGQSIAIKVCNSKGL